MAKRSLTKELQDAIDKWGSEEWCDLDSISHRDEKLAEEVFRVLREHPNIKCCNGDGRCFYCVLPHEC